jgi:alpha-amylase/alpha-mannosidase (GH57 family)
MPVLRVAILWHQHQPFYKDLVTGEYRLPWVRLHALKDYYGMVKLLDEFPDVHQTFNLVPSLVTQIQDYAGGTAHDPFLEVAAKPAEDLTPDERQFALRYLFQANQANMIGRYPRYQELWETLRGAGSDPQRAGKYFFPQDFTDLQVLSQIAWFDEFFLEDPDVANLIAKGRNYSLEDQEFVIARQRSLIAKVLPAHAEAARKGKIEISASPFYHPILPLVCDTNVGAVSSPGLPLPRNRFRYPEDAKEQIQRGLDLHEKVFAIRPRGVWPSEGSVSEEALGIASTLGVKWMATDEEVLGRTLGISFSRDGTGRLAGDAARKLYTLYRYENGESAMHLIFRDHTISDLIGFVYSGMPPQDAANHLINSIRQAAQPVLDSGRDVLVSIILDGENAWEYYPRSGREFLRRFYDQLDKEPMIEAVTVSEAIERHRDVEKLASLVPGSWIRANFNVWIGAREDNRAWDYLYNARTFYSQVSPNCTAEQQKLAHEELLIAEGSDWNWWYGPEHSSANDREFDELYRKHLSNVYQALGTLPPDYLAQPINRTNTDSLLTPQSAYIHPRITGDSVRYFEWMGAAVYTPDRRAGAMHGKKILLDSMYAGVDETFLYARLDFSDKIPESDFELVVNIESFVSDQQDSRRALRLNAAVEAGEIRSWILSAPDQQQPVATSTLPQSDMQAAFGRSFEFRLPLAWLFATTVAEGREARKSARKKVLLRASLWQNRLPADALPDEGWMELSMEAGDEWVSH